MKLFIKMCWVGGLSECSLDEMNGLIIEGNGWKCDCLNVCVYGGGGVGEE